MPEARLNEIFQGVTPGPHRTYLASQFPKLSQVYPALVIPCAGRFSLAEVAADSGWKNGAIYCSDISLFTTLIGRAIEGRSADGLGVKIVAPELEFLKEYVGGEKEFGAILYAMKWAQIRMDRYFERQYADDMERDTAGYVTKLQEDLNCIAKRLKGSHYVMADMWDEIEKYRNDPNVVLLVNPPGYAKGYTKMYDFTGTLEWDAPEVAEFDPKTDHLKMYELLMDAKALAIMYRYQAIEREFSGNCVFGREYSIERTDYWVCNRPDEMEKKVSLRLRTDTMPSKYPLLPVDYEITSNSHIELISTTQGIAMYYRDLFAHKLGATRAEGYYLFLIDGCVFSVFGMFFSNANRGEIDYLMEIFGFTTNSNRYRRLNKLFMMLLTSKPSREIFVRSQTNLIMRDVVGMSTTCITRYPELKTNRGVLKLTKRKKMPDGRYKLRYYAEFKDCSWSERVAEWIKRGWNV